jgi:hypothetical protein
MAGEARLVLRLIDGFAIEEPAEPPAARGGVFLGVLNHDLTVVAAPGTKAAGNSTDETCFARIAPSGNGRALSRYAFTAIAFPRMARSSLRGSGSRDGAINSHWRYPSGIVTPKIGEGPSPSARPGASGIKMMAHATTMSAHVSLDIRFIVHPLNWAEREITKLIVALVVQETFRAHWRQHDLANFHFTFRPRKSRIKGTISSALSSRAK